MKRDADADADRDRLAVHLERQRHLPYDPVGQGRRIGWPVEQRLGDGELVAADAGDRIHLANSGRQAARRFDQHLVADRRAERVGQGLEAMQVDVQQRDATGRSLCRRDHPAERVLQHPPVAHAGKPIGIGQPVDLACVALAGARSRTVSTRSAEPSVRRATT